MKANTFFSRLRRRTSVKQYPVAEVVLVALITSCITYNSGILRGENSNVLAALFSDCSPTRDQMDLCLGSPGSKIAELLYSGAIYFLLSSYSTGMVVPAGLFIPSMLIGGMFGRAVGILVNWTQVSFRNSPLFAECSGVTACVTPGLYGIIGAAAVLTGVTRMTVSLVVVVFEITGSLQYALPVMMAIICAKWCSDAVTQ